MNKQADRALAIKLLKSLGTSTAIGAGAVFAPSASGAVYDRLHKDDREAMFDRFADAWDKSKKVGPIGTARLVRKHNKRENDNLGLEWIKSRILNACYDPLDHRVVFLHPAAGRDTKSKITSLWRVRIPESTVKHELGHATNPLSIKQRLKDVIDSKVMPFRRLKNNKIYKEEVRAWDNAEKMDGKIDKDLRDAALSTYEYGANRNRVTSATGYASLAAVAGRVLYNRRHGVRGFGILQLIKALR